MVGVGEPDVGIVLILNVARIARHRVPGAQFLAEVRQRPAATQLRRADLVRQFGTRREVGDRQRRAPVRAFDPEERSHLRGFPDAFHDVPVVLTHSALALIEHELQVVETEMSKAEGLDRHPLNAYPWHLAPRPLQSWIAK